MSDNKKSNETPVLVVTDDNVLSQVNKFKGISRFYPNDMNDGYMSYFELSDDIPDGVNVGNINIESGININAEVEDDVAALKYCHWIALFIERLPDDLSIRFGAFFMMCDLRDYYLSKQ